MGTDPIRLQSLELRVRGMVQGVGFRPTVWRIATELGLVGEVRNDAEGVLIRIAGAPETLERFGQRLVREAPILARIDTIERTTLRDPVEGDGFRIARSRPGMMATAIAPDAATCDDCMVEVLTPSERRFRYPFTNCTNCGPRMTIVESAPYDRANTTMRAFAMCPLCALEYADPSDRRFHAQPIACPSCGPKLTLSRLDREPLVGGLDHDVVTATAALISRGAIVAVKGLGGVHLVCDATDPNAVATLRTRKRRFGKAFAVMMPDIETARRWCVLGGLEERLLLSPAAPIVLVQPGGGDQLPDAIAPGLSALGIMLPYTPLHHLLMRELARPAVVTSGNMSDEPQCIDGEEARASLASVADYLLDHDRPIVSRMDDSVLRVMADRPAIFRRARGVAPTPLGLHSSFARSPLILAMGGELKSTFCLIRDGQAILSQHLGDLENASSFDDFRRTLDLYLGLFGHTPRVCAVDRHPEYLSSKLGRERADRDDLALLEIQHHHAHVAACLAENGVALDAPAVLGVVLDGTGLGDDETIWGGEFLHADYREYRRVGALESVAMPGAAQAVREPWRNTLAHILAAMDWSEFDTRFRGTTLHSFLAAKPVATIASMIRTGTNAPLASSCGRLFDAVAGALGIVADRQSHEGEAAARLEALVDPGTLARMADHEAYPFPVEADREGMPRLTAKRMWLSLLADAESGVSASFISTRFHKGLAIAVAGLAADLSRVPEPGAERIVVLSGGCFQNKLLLEGVKRRLEKHGVHVLFHAKVPANDGGLSLGQAVVAAARTVVADQGN